MRMSPLIFVWDGDTLADLRLPGFDAGTDTAPNWHELELVRIFQEYKQLLAESKACERCNSSMSLRKIIEIAKKVLGYDQ
jgi:hypothetical protein